MLWCLMTHGAPVSPILRPVQNNIETSLYFHNDIGKNKYMNTPSLPLPSDSRIALPEHVASTQAFRKQQRRLDKVPPPFKVYRSFSFTRFSFLTPDIGFS